MKEVVLNSLFGLLRIPSLKVISNLAFKSKNSSNIWLARQNRDPYVKRAVKELYRARYLKT